MANKQLVVVICGDTFPQVRQACGDFADWLAAMLPASAIELIIWNAHAQEEPPELSNVAGVIVSGSPAMVTDRADWSENLGRWLVHRVQENMPVFGICYGHQLLADALGGRVDFQPDGREIGSLLIQQLSAAQTDPLFMDLPPTFYAHLTHGQSVFQLPEKSVCLASSQRVPVQAFRYGESCWGVQFHPEFNETIMAMYLAAYREQIPTEMRLQLKTHSHSCPEAGSLLLRFANYCLNGSVHQQTSGKQASASLNECLRTAHQ